MDVGVYDYYFKQSDRAVCNANIMSIFETFDSIFKTFDIHRILNPFIIYFK